MTYSCDTDDARIICEILQWRFGTRPVKTMRRAGKVYVTGTLLKPDEWQTLACDIPRKMPDETPVVLTGLPTRIRRDFNAYIGFFSNRSMG